LAKSNKIIFVFLIVVFALFFAGLVRLFMLRFEAGDLYAPYSSMRSDPLGTRALYDGLDDMDRVSVERSFRPLSRGRDWAGTTLFYTGARAAEIRFEGKGFIDSFEPFVLSGGRLVVSFLPAGQKPPPVSTSSRAKPQGKDKSGVKKEAGSPSKKKDGGSNAGEDEAAGDFTGRERIKERWGIGLDYAGSAGKDRIAAAALGSSRGGLPPVITLHTAMYFDLEDDAWKVVYARAGLPVIVERRLGRGSLVFYADSYLLSNEALREERLPGLLAWFLGGNGRVIFDEAHLGIRERTGIAGLARKYRFHWLFAGLVILVGLFVWKNTAHFVPPRDEEPFSAAGDHASRRDYAQGLMGLLRRNIPRRRILRVCYDEWEKSFGAEREGASSRLDKMRAVIESEDSAGPGKRDPVEAYRTICRMLSKRSRQGP
jgi:uncharacterized protein DUF4350